MKAVILAAGKGERLGIGPGPKPLTLLSNGISILQLQIDRLASFFSSDDIFVVVGYRKEMIMDLFPQVHFVFNDSYAGENTSKSLLKALKELDDDLLWLNGDVVFHPSILEQVLAQDRSSMLVNRGAVGDEEVKYRTDLQGNIVEVSKKVEKPEGEALGINFFKKKDLPLLREGLVHCAPSDYFEKGIEYAILKGVQVGSIVVEKDQCVEIDFPQDVERANVLIRKWSDEEHGEYRL